LKLGLHTFPHSSNNCTSQTTCEPPYWYV